MKCQNFYQSYKDFWGTLDVDNSNYEVVDNRIGVLKERTGDFIKLYNCLGDYRSKFVLQMMLSNWLRFDYASIIHMKENNFTDYYDFDLLSCDENEVLVDVGAYTGDSALDYILCYGKYKKIYCYEITADSVLKLQENLREYPDIDIRNKGVGDKNSVMYLDDKKDQSGNRITDGNGETAVEVVRLDDDISEEITLLKMDIEGSEISALKGAAGHIKSEKPKLLICVYHSNTDILEIPKLIQEMRGDYKFYLRSNGTCFGPAEIVLFAL